MNQRYRLAIMREETSVRNIHDLQHLGIVTDLEGHGKRVLGSGEQNVYGKSRTLGLSDARRIEAKGRRAAGCGSRWRLIRRRNLRRRALRLGWNCGSLCRSLSWRRGRHRMADAAELNRVGCAHVDGLLVHVVIFMGAHDVRNQHEYGFSFRVVSGRLGKEILQDWNLAESGNAG